MAGIEKVSKVTSELPSGVVNDLVQGLVTDFDVPPMDAVTVIVTSIVADLLDIKMIIHAPDPVFTMVALDFATTPMGIVIEISALAERLMDAPSNEKDRDSSSVLLSENVMVAVFS